jgi:3-phenylpropionate/trans-cinnamate dioxygenase ferredoxin reductase component
MTMGTTSHAIVIVGAGLAGAKAAEALRVNGFQGDVVLIGEEFERPYERPPLSKEYLLGKAARDEIYLHPPSWYTEHDIDLRLGSRVIAIDRGGHTATTEDGETFGYDKLLLATGSSPRELTVPGAEARGVHYLRRVDDSEALREAFATSRRVAIIGAGWIGLETAAAARATGCDVTVIARGLQPLRGALGEEVAATYAALHRAHLVDFRLSADAAEIVTTHGRVTGVRLTDGTFARAETVVIGIGVTPNTVLAKAAGLPVADGIIVDEYLATTDPDVYAAGEVANVYYPFLGTRLRLEHWSAALNQGPAAAISMIGARRAYDYMPYFFSDQYDSSMEYTGHVARNGYDTVVFRGNVSSGQFVAFWCKDDTVLAGMNVNVWDVAGDIEALVRSGARVDPGDLADSNVPLANLVAAAPR